MTGLFNVEDALANLRTAADRHRGAEPSAELISAARALNDIDPGDAERALELHLDALAGTISDSGAAFLAIMLGSRAERGRDPEPVLPTLAEQFLARLRRLAEGLAKGNDPEPDLAHAVDRIAQAVVAHIIRVGPDNAGRAALDAEIALIEELSGTSNGATWVLQALTMTSGEIMAIDLANRRGGLFRYENLANCFHLFTLFQACWSTHFPSGADANLSHEPHADDVAPRLLEAWWHYGVATSPKPEPMAVIFGEMSPNSIPSLDGKQVILLWPPILASRTWDAGFLHPVIEGALPELTLLRELEDDEVDDWLDRAGVVKPKGFLARLFGR